MKRYGNLWPLICDRKNIEEAADKALKGKPATKDRQRFLDNRTLFIDELEASMKNESYVFSPLYAFTVYEPKMRVIHCPPFYPDRILHHAAMNVMVPLFMSKFTDDTYGSIKGRGVKLAGEKLSNDLRNNPDSYFLQVDMKHFYQSIDHAVAKEQIRRVVKCKKTQQFFDAIIDIHGQGMPIGSYTSQYVGNLILSPIDHWAKEVAKVKHYYRYMDDIVMLVPNKETAHKVLRLLTEQLTALKLVVKNNVRIAPVGIGIDFIGYKFYPTHTRLRRRIKLRMQRNIRKLVKNNVSDAYFKRKTASHFGWCIHANCRNLLRKTFDNKLYLYQHRMEIPRLSKLKEAKNWFGLSKQKRISIEQLYEIEIAFFDFIETSIKGETKVVVKFAYPIFPEDYHYFITRSDVMRDRLTKDKELMPFIASIRRVKKYIGYE